MNRFSLLMHRFFLLKLSIFLLIILSGNISISGQDIVNARKYMDTLASPAMYGRGYVNNGTGIAAEYISQQMRKIGLKPFNLGFKQDFFTDVMTYPSAMKLVINGKKMKPADDFTVMTGSPSIKGSFEVILLDSTYFKHLKKIDRLKKDGLENCFIAYNPVGVKGHLRKVADSLFRNNTYGCAGFIHVLDKSSLSWSVRSPAEVLPFPVVSILKSSFPEEPQSLDIDIELKEINNFTLSNVTGYVPGSAQPDSFVVVTAHYDHLGMMGEEAMFPGANDNASGTAMLLDMAEYYVKNKPPFSIVFMAFAGEELGLKGSEHAVDFPVFPLKKIKFLINLDMVGTGSEGITMVNAEQLPGYYERMVKINADNEYILKVAKRGESCNSDHCPFFQKGVPAVFIYSMGKEHTEYHSPKDHAKAVSLTEYEDIFRLLRDFIATL